MVDSEILIDDLPHCHSRTVKGFEKVKYRPKTIMVCECKSCLCENCDFKNRCVILRPFDCVQEVLQ